MNKECLLYSSGIDSYIARRFLISHGHDIDCLYFNHGGRYCKHEIEKIKSLCFPVIISDNLRLGDLEQANAHIPNRNLLMITMAQSLGYDRIWLGGSLSDRVGDNKSEVCVELSKILSSVNDIRCVVDSPFYGCYKDDMVRWFATSYKHNIPQLAENTFSCFNPLSEPREYVMLSDDHTKSTYHSTECMSCSACFRKCAVVYSANIFLNFNNGVISDIMNGYKDQFMKILIATPRSEGTLRYIDKWMEINNGTL